MEENLYEQALHILGFKRWWPHQTQLFERFIERLNNLSPVRLFLSVPCGWGKTEAAVIPFLSQFLSQKYVSQKVFASRMVYVLPSCVLVDQVAERTSKYLSKILNNRPLDDIFHFLFSQHNFVVEELVEKDYGFHREPPAEIYCGLAVITTLDSFSARLFPSKLTKPKYIDLVRGKLLRAYLVFDEIHSYDLYTLGFIRGLLHFVNEVEIPHVVMTATLNKNQQGFLGINSGYSIIEQRAARECCKVSLRNDMKYDGSNEKLAKIVLSLLEEIKNESDLSNSRILIVCNTVRKAQYVYEQIKKRFGNKVKPEIIHSRFTGEDRKKKVNSACSLLKRKDVNPSHQGGIVVSTQVIESGTDISADYLITEMAPPDALIQRIGRCTRELRVPVFKQGDDVKLGKAFIIPVEVNKRSRDNIHMKPYPWYWVLCSQAALTDVEGKTENIVLEHLISITPAVRSDFRAIVVQDYEENLDISEFLSNRFGMTSLCDVSDLKSLLNEAKEGYDEFNAWLKFRMHIPKPSSFPKVRENERYMILVGAIDEVKETAMKIKEAVAESDYNGLRRLRKKLREIEEKYAVPVDARVLERFHLNSIEGIHVFYLPEKTYVYDNEKGLIIIRENN